MNNKKILLLIPTCMVNQSECVLSGKDGITGYKCISNNCSSNCQISQLKKICKLHNIFYKITGESGVKNIIDEEKPDTLIGIACKKELIKFKDISDYTIEIIDGNCKNSKINLLEATILLEEISNGV